MSQMYSSQKRTRSSSASAAKRTKTTRRNYGVKKTININPNQGLVPISYTYTAKYVEQVSFSIVAGVAFAYQFNLNSIFDPNFTGAGHQPMGHDQIEQLYTKYRVNSVRYEVVPFIQNGTNCNLFVGPINNSSPPTSGFKEYPQTQFRQLGGSNTSSEDTMKGYVKLWELASTTQSKYNADDQYSALMSADPAEKMLLTIYCDDLLTVNNATVLATVTMYMNVTCFDRVELRQS